MQTMRVHGWDEFPQLDELPVPVAGPGEALIRVHSASISHLDRTIAGGKFSVQPELPYVGGTDGAGEVVTSSRFTPGTPVMLRGGGLGLTRAGTWAEYVTVPEEVLEELPAGIAFDLATAAYSPVTTACIALSSVGRLGEWGTGTAAEETVAVAGATGAVGVVALQLALRAGSRAIGFVRSAEDAALLPPGAEAVLLSDEQHRDEFVRDRPITLLIDTIGGAGMIERMQWVEAGGRAAVVGYLAGTQVSLDLPNWLFSDVALLPVNMIRRRGEGATAFAQLAPELVSGDISVPMTVAPMSDGPQVYRDLESGRIRTRLVLNPGH